MSYQIAILRHTYMPDLQSDRSPRIYSDSHNVPIEYDTADAAKTQIAEWEGEVYITSHNESGRPTYLVVESVDGDYIHNGRNGDLSNYDWDGWQDFCSRDDDACGECSGCTKHMIDQDREYLLGKAIKDTLKFTIPTDPDHYGSEFQEYMIDEFEQFAKNYLKKLGYHAETYRTHVIPIDDDYDLRLKVWTAYCNS
jgi:hypothetical protein